ncbi:hypothetical protein FB451DRAFT_107859 [Mycena latifolia]|nr:hypothetical protein FB451DRAFT_107859 [Mycena latifolia]
MHLGQFSAYVSVDDVKLSEYTVETSADGTQATCWIPSENGKEFRVKFQNRDARANCLISGRVHVDGMRCGGTHLEIRHGGHTSAASLTSVYTSTHTRRPLTFGKQALTDDDAYLNAAISPDFGTIKVVLAHVKPLIEKPGKMQQAFEPQILHERSKKSIGHTIQFGPAFHSRNRLKKSGGLIKELVTFIFKYRPIELLRAEGIAPPAPREERAVTPVDVLDLTMDVDTDDDADAEIKKLEARLGLLKDRKKGVKRESGEVKKEIKSEEPIFKPGEVIDLT